LIAVTAVGSLTLIAGLYLHAREVFVDDTGHAAMIHLLAAGQFPLRFPCNPELTASYAYGGDLLAATVMVVAHLRPWEAMDVVAPAALAGALMLAFASGWTLSRRVGSGLLAVGLLLTAGSMVWLLVPFVIFPATENSLLGFLSHVGHQLLESPWTLAIVPPGFITPTYAHVQRSISWVFGPFLLLLTLVVSEAVTAPYRRAVVLAVMIAAAALLHVAVLVILVPGIMLQCVTQLWAGRKGKRSPGLGYAGVSALLAGLGLAMVQGGVLTDAIIDRLQGVPNAASTFTWAFPQLPSCRLQPVTPGCVILSALNLGLVPFCLPWIAYRVFRAPGCILRRVLVLGAAVAYLVTLCFRYGYGDWNLQRLNAYATWILAVLLAPGIGDAFVRSRRAGRVALALGLLLAGGSGLVTMALVVAGRGLRDAERQDFGPPPPPLDLVMMPVAARLPMDARFFDPAGCFANTGNRPGLLFGRYLVASASRRRFQDSLPAFEAVSRAPTRDTLLRSGFTHLYLDDGWYKTLSDSGRTALENGPVAVVAAVQGGGDFRALLRVCRPEEACPGFVPARDVPLQ